MEFLCRYYVKMRCNFYLGEDTYMCDESVETVSDVPFLGTAYNFDLVELVSGNCLMSMTGVLCRMMMKVLKLSLSLFVVLLMAVIQLKW